MKRMALAVLLSVPLFGGTLIPAGSLQIERSGHDAALLPDGRVLIAGGNAGTRQLEVFHVEARNSSLAGETPLPLSIPRATALPDRVVITGGGYRTDGRAYFGRYGDTFIGTYDRSGYRGPTGALNDARSQHTATALPDGRILIAGGMTLDLGGFHVWRDYSDSIEIFDPATNTSRLVGRLREARAAHTATLLRDGRVLIAGGNGDTLVGNGSLQSVEIFRPDTNTIEWVGSMLEARTEHAATLLADGRVLITGGSSEFPAAEIFDPVTKTFAPGAFIGWRTGHTATLLHDGRVFIAGGEFEREAVIYDPESDAVVERFPTDGFRSHAAVLLEDGSVLLIGGRIETVTRLKRVLRFYPGPRPVKRRAIRR